MIDEEVRLMQEFQSTLLMRGATATNRFQSRIL